MSVAVGDNDRADVAWDELLRDHAKKAIAANGKTQLRGAQLEFDCDDAIGGESVGDERVWTIRVPSAEVQEDSSMKCDYALIHHNWGSDRVANRVFGCGDGIHRSRTGRAGPCKKPTLLKEEPTG